MRILLDTCIACWTVAGSRRLSRSWRQFILDADEVHVSAATLRELAITHSLGGGSMPMSSVQALQAFQGASYTLFAVKPEHAARVEDLPALHGDPFDRRLLAQARFEPMTLRTLKTLMTSVRLLGQYGAGVELVLCARRMRLSKPHAFPRWPSIRSATRWAPWQQGRYTPGAFIQAGPPVASWHRTCM